MTGTDLHHPAAPRTTGAMATPIGISHVAALTSDLARHRRFYEGVIGLRASVVLRMEHPPHLRHAVYLVDDRTALHVFEDHSFEDRASGEDGAGPFGRRGRLDHLGFMVDGVASLEAVRDRLVAAGASSGEIVPLGPVLSVRFCDPDGLEGEVNCVHEDFDPTAPGEVVEHDAGDGWFERLLAATRP